MQIVRDLLVRHERLIHHIEPNRATNPFSNRLNPNLRYTDSPNTDQLNHMAGQHPDMSFQRPFGYSLDLLSDAAHHLLSRSLEAAKQEPIIPEPSQDPSLDEDTMRNTDLKLD